MEDRLTYAQAAEILGCGLSNVPKLIAKGRLPVHRGPGRVRGHLHLADVEALAVERRAAAAARKSAPRRREPVDHRPDTEHEWLPPSQVARMLGVTPQAVIGRIHRGKLPAVESGGRWWVRRDLLEQVEAARLVLKTRRP